MTNELIKIETTGNNEKMVSGRELHEFLGIKTRYNDWFNRVCEYGFTANIDYIAHTQKRVTGQGNETEFTDHYMSLDMAKEICMIQRSEKGKQARQYFIEVEKQFKAMQLDSYMIADPVSRAKKWIEEEQHRQQLSAELEAAQPKIEFACRCMESETTIDMQSVAHVLGYRGYGRNNLFHFLTSAGVLIDSKRPYQRQIDAGRFQVVETVFEIQGKDCVSKKIVVTQKGLDYIRQLVEQDIHQKQTRKIILQ